MTWYPHGLIMWNSRIKNQAIWTLILGQAIATISTCRHQVTYSCFTPDFAHWIKGDQTSPLNAVLVWGVCDAESIGPICFQNSTRTNDKRDSQWQVLRLIIANYTFPLTNSPVNCHRWILGTDFGFCISIGNGYSLLNCLEKFFFFFVQRAL